MTDATTPEQPRTAAEWDTLARSTLDLVQPEFRDALLRVSEAEARPAVASEGLLREVRQHTRDTHGGMCDCDSPTGLGGRIDAAIAATPVASEPLRAEAHMEWPACNCLTAAQHAIRLAADAGSVGEPKPYPTCHLRKHRGMPQHWHTEGPNEDASDAGRSVGALDVERLAKAFFNTRQAGNNDTGWDDLLPEWQEDELHHMRQALAEYAAYDAEVKP